MKERVKAGRKTLSDGRRSDYKESEFRMARRGSDVKPLSSVPSLEEWNAKQVERKAEIEAAESRRGLPPIASFDPDKFERYREPIVIDEVNEYLDQNYLPSRSLRQYLYDDSNEMPYEITPDLDPDEMGYRIGINASLDETHIGMQAYLNSKRQMEAIDGGKGNYIRILQIHKCPAAIIMSVDRFKEQYPRCSVYGIVSSALGIAQEWIDKRGEVINFKEAYARSRRQDTLADEVFLNALTTQLEFPPESDQELKVPMAKHRRNYEIPKEQHEWISSTSKQLGLPMHLIGIFCMMATLANFPNTLRFEAVAMATSVKLFLQIIGLRADLAHKIMDRMEESQIAKV